MVDPLIAALIDRLPTPETRWTVENRAAWLKTMALAFRLVYKDQEHPAADSSLIEVSVIPDRESAVDVPETKPQSTITASSESEPIALGTSSADSLILSNKSQT